MIDHNHIIDINHILELCGAAKLTDEEINFMNATGQTVANDCDLYTVAYSVIIERSSSQDLTKPIERIKTLADSKGCSITEQAIKKDPVNVPIFGVVIDE